MKISKLLAMDTPENTFARYFGSTESPQGTHQKIEKFSKM